MPLVEESDNSKHFNFHGSPRKILRFKEEMISPPQKINPGPARLPSLHRMTSLLAYEPIMVTFVKNGDKFFEGVKVNITQRNMRSWENLLSELSRRIDLPAGVRHIYTPNSGHKVKSLSQLEHNNTYVCGSLEPFKKIDYRNVKNPDWKVVSKSRVSETEMQSIFSTNFPLSPCDPSVSFSASTRSFGNLDSNIRKWMEASRDGGRKKSQKSKTVPIMSIAEPPESTIQLNQSVGSLRPLGITNGPKHLVLTIYGNGPLQSRECATVYVNRTTIKSWEEAKQLISENLKTINGCLRLYKLDGEEVESLSQLWTAGNNLIAAGEEEFHLSDFLMGTKGNHKLLVVYLVKLYEKKSLS